ncbi:hypothetical protein [Streptomyces sioyaensis]|uniref:hypothetical protein n=1 Tax=Streptomyces sioyaensis TaxID=67364 RepID=UPI00371EE711
MSELIAAVFGALIGGGFALAGARIQARGAHAQADAARDAAKHQAATAHMQWVRSKKSNAYAAFVALTLEFQDQAFHIHCRYQDPAFPPTALQRWHNRKTKSEDSRALHGTFKALRDTLAVVELYGPSEVADTARELERACATLSMTAEGWVRAPGLPPFDWNTDLTAVQQARERFAEAARPHLDDSTIAP